MKNISSRDNPLFKQMLKVAQERVKQQVLLEGEHLCEMWWRFRGQPNHVILNHAIDYQGSSMQTLIEQVPTERHIFLSDSLFKQLNSVASPQAIMFWVQIEQSPVSAPIPQRSAVYLDRIQDPGNLGTILRSCAGAAIEQVYLSPGCANPWSPKVLRSAQGAHFVLQIYTQVEGREFLSRNTLAVMITHLSAQSRSLYDADLRKDCLWIFGNEGQGVSATLLPYGQSQIHIPQSDRIESLNVGVACGIVLFEQCRQRRVTALS